MNTVKQYFVQTNFAEISIPKNSGFAFRQETQATSAWTFSELSLEFHNPE